MDFQKIKFPKIVEFQTHTLCNGYCKICPYEEAKEVIPYCRMSDENVDILIKELEEHKEDIERVCSILK